MHAAAQRLLDLVLGDGLATEVLLEQLVVALADLFDQLFAIGLGLVQHVGRDLFDDVLGAHRLVLVDDGLHPDQVDHAAEPVLAPMGSWIATGLACELRLDLLSVRAKSAPMRSILLTKQMRGTRYLSACRHTVSDCGSTPATDVENRHRAVENAQRPLDFDGEVDVPGVSMMLTRMIAPETGRRGRRDRDAALLFLLHPVHDRRALVDLADLVRDPGVEEDPLGRRRLAGIDVGHDADVPRAIEW